MQRSPVFRLIVLASLLAIAAGPGSVSTHRDAESERIAAMFARGYVKGRSGQLFIVPDSGYFLIKGGDALHNYQHGTPWPCDTHIPLLFWGPGFVKPGPYTDSASLQNVAPTLLRMVHAPIPPKMTGKPLPDTIPNATRRPAVVVLIVLDGMGRATWDHWEDSLSTLKRLRQQGAWFDNAALNYLPTVTAVGHATVSTGTDPRFHGIQSNRDLDGDMYHGIEMLPDSLRTRTLADAWERELPENAVIAVHGTSARATVGLAGHGKCAQGGRAITVAMFDEQQIGWFANSNCYRMVPDYLRADTLLGFFLKHRAPSENTWELFLRNPWLPDLEADALVALIANEHIGRDAIPDLLLVNLKSSDYVSHEYGPFSPQVGTALRHVDSALERIVHALDAATGERGYVLAVTADHGMPTAQAPGEDAFTVQSLGDSLRSHFGIDSTVVPKYDDASSHQLYVNRGKLPHNVTLDSLGRYLGTLPHVKYAFTEDEIKKVTL